MRPALPCLLQTSAECADRTHVAHFSVLSELRIYFFQISLQVAEVHSDPIVSLLNEVRFFVDKSRVVRTVAQLISKVSVQSVYIRGYLLNAQVEMFNSLSFNYNLFCNCLTQRQ